MYIILITLCIKNLKFLIDSYLLLINLELMLEVIIDLHEILLVNI